MLTLTNDQKQYMDSAAREQVKMITDCMARSSKFGRCPVDIRGALLGLTGWLRSSERDFNTWDTATNYAHGILSEWREWISRDLERPRVENDGLSTLELYELFKAVGTRYRVINVKRGAA